MPRLTPQQLAIKISLQVQKRAASGVQAAAVFLAARWKEALSVPAPRKRVVDSAGNISYRATTRATPGAAPRKLSGKFRQSVTYTLYKPSTGASRGKIKAMAATVGAKARSIKGFNYPKGLEKNGHPSLMPTVRKYRKDLSIIMGRAIRIKQP